MDRLEEEGLKLRKQRLYNGRNSGLSKLVFDGECARLYRNGSSFRIVNLELTPSACQLESAVSDKEYDKLLFPSYSLMGNIENSEYGFICGIISPFISEVSEYPEINPYVPPIFSFYIEGIDRNWEYIAGKSILFSGNMLVAGIFSHKKIDIKEINESFGVALPAKPEIIHFQK